VSHPKLPATIIANTKTAYVRMHGVPKMFYSDYSTEEMAQLIQTLKKKKKLNTAYIYFNNTAGVAGIENAQQLLKMV
jgi:uncharacterized protein YecE (DUF72 family)